MSVTDYIKQEGKHRFLDGIDYVHPEYAIYAPLWKKARDIIMGEDQLKKTANKEKYLPRLGGHAHTTEGDQDYNAFVGYAMLYNATGRTVDAYRGLLNRKLPVISIPETLTDLLQDFTIKGESIYTFIEQVEVEVITTNRVGLFIDHPTTEDKPLTKTEAVNKHIAPYATMYTAESIINWEEERRNNKIVTSLVVLKEVNFKRVSSFTPVEQITYRVLELDEDGYYRQIVVQPVQEQLANNLYGPTRMEIKSVLYPRVDGKKMTAIPFYPITAQGVTWDLSKSIIDDLINVNLAHYRDTALYEKAIAWTASPTAVFSGIPEDIDNISIGSSQAIIIAQGGTAKYLEYEGKGLDDIATSLKSKEDLMTILGAKILANTANGIESGEAAMIHRAGEQGILADIATTVGGAIEKALRTIIRWGGTTVSDKDVAVDITKDYTPTATDANMVIALGKELDSGHISYPTYLKALQRGEIVVSTRTADEEMADINKYREGTVISTKSNVTYLDKTRASAILGRDDELVDAESSSNEGEPSKEETTVEE